MSKTIFVEGLAVHMYGRDMSSEEATQYAKEVIAEHSGKGKILAIHIQASRDSVAIYYDLRVHPIFKLR